MDSQQSKTKKAAEQFKKGADRAFDAVRKGVDAVEEFAMEAVDRTASAVKRLRNRQQSED